MCASRVPITGITVSVSVYICRSEWGNIATAAIRCRKGACHFNHFILLNYTMPVSYRKVTKGCQGRGWVGVAYSYGRFQKIYNILS